MGELRRSEREVLTSYLINSLGKGTASVVAEKLSFGLF
jgi:hypothetical protein